MCQTKAFGGAVLAPLCLLCKWWLLGVMRFAFVLNGPCGILYFQLLLEHLTISIITTHMLSMVDFLDLFVHSPQLIWRRLFN